MAAWSSARFRQAKAVSARHLDGQLIAVLGVYAEGAPLERKNGWQLAEAAGDAAPDQMQRLLAGDRWDFRLVREDLRGYVAGQLTLPSSEGALAGSYALTHVYSTSAGTTSYVARALDNRTPSRRSGRLCSSVRLDRGPLRSGGLAPV